MNVVDLKHLSLITGTKKWRYRGLVICSGMNVHTFFNKKNKLKTEANFVLTTTYIHLPLPTRTRSKFFQLLHIQRAIS